MIGLAKERIFVTGAGGGIGSAVVRHLKGAGARVAATDLGIPAGLGADFATECDVTESASVGQAIHESAEALGGLSSIVYVTGYLHEAYPTVDFPVAEWNKVLDINVTGMLRVAQAGIPHLRANGGGTMVGVSSWWSYQGHAYFAAYCASKAALRILTQSMAEELSSDGIRVNCVAPGNIDTTMHRDALATEAEKRGITFEEMKAIEWAKIPLAVAGPPQSIADAIKFLVSDESSYITGATIDVNGGVLLR